MFCLLLLAPAIVYLLRQIYIKLTHTVNSLQLGAITRGFLVIELLEVPRTWKWIGISGTSFFCLIDATEAVIGMEFFPRYIIDPHKVLDSLGVKHRNKRAD